MIDIVAKYTAGRRDFASANLTGAYLTGAYLARANLTCASLTGANLARANLTRASLTGANLAGATLPHFQICPERGGFTAYKKLAGNALCLLHVPADAKRASSLVGRKCRASHAKVLALKTMAGEKLLEARSLRSSAFVYRVGEIVRAHDFDPDIRVECSAGIHFFVTRREAEEWQG